MRIYNYTSHYCTITQLIYRDRDLQCNYSFTINNKKVLC